MSAHAWLADLTEELGTARRSGQITRQEAVTRLRDAIDEHAERLLVLSIYSDYAGKALDAWHREHQHAGPTLAVSHVQAELFPDLRPRLAVQPGVTKPVMALTAHDWDNAKEMLHNRTKHAIEGAEADRKHFDEAYEKVRPLLTGDATTADVVPELRGQVPLEGLA